MPRSFFLERQGSSGHDEDRFLMLVCNRTLEITAKTKFKKINYLEATEITKNPRNRPRSWNTRACIHGNVSGSLEQLCETHKDLLGGF